MQYFYKLPFLSSIFDKCIYQLFCCRKGWGHFRIIKTEQEMFCLINNLKKFGKVLSTISPFFASLLVFHLLLYLYWIQSLTSSLQNTFSHMENQMQLHFSLNIWPVSQVLNNSNLVSRITFSLATRGDLSRNNLPHPMSGGSLFIFNSKSPCNEMSH